MACEYLSILFFVKLFCLWLYNELSLLISRPFLCWTFKDLMDYAVSLSVIQTSHLLRSLNHKISTCPTYLSISLNLISALFSHPSTLGSLFFPLLPVRRISPLSSLYKNIFPFWPSLFSLSYLVFWRSLTCSHHLITVCLFDTTRTHTLTHANTRHIHQSNCANRQFFPTKQLPLLPWLPPEHLNGYQGHHLSVCAHMCMHTPCVYACRRRCAGF